MKTPELMDRLERHYRKPGAARDGEVLLREVAAPGGSGRRADLVRIGMWRSRGAGIDVHELKVSRADWLRELEDPGKAEAWWPYCSRFWVVAPSTDVVVPEEVPPGWGLMVPPTTSRGRRFRVVVKPTTKDPRLTVALMLELVRRTDNTRLAEIDRLRGGMREQIRDEVDRRVQERAARGLGPETRARLDHLDRLEELLGVELGGWGVWGPLTDERNGATADEVAAVLRDQAHGHINLQRIRTKALQALERAQGSVEHASKQLQAATRNVQEVGTE